MLNNDSLSQLSQLKKNIQDSKDYGTGRVVGSNGRFGFVKLDDGRDAYLAPDKMQRLIPGDIVKVSVTKNKNDKLEANLEKLVEPAIARFVGQYRVKDKAHFIQPSGQQASRWVFVPPKSRNKNFQDGDYVIGKIITHPFKDGKASAKVVEKIGNGDEANFELTFVKAKYQLNPIEDEKIGKQSQEIETTFTKSAFGDRKDFTEIPFVTIDAETTQDMDDAIAIEKPEGDDTANYRLKVAIADPSHFITQNSLLAKRARLLGQSAYLLGGTTPMLPSDISHHCFSLEPNKVRPALVVTIDVDSAGEIQDATFEFGQVESKFKLSYEGVAAFLNGNAEQVPESCHEHLTQLKAFALTRRKFRESQFLVPQDQPDYDYQLDDKGHIASINIRERNIAHQIVEEAMLATNMCAAQLLAENNSGICNSHSGFREERLGEVKALLKEENIEFGELKELEHHVALFKSLEASEEKAKLSAPLRRMMDPAQLSTTPAPHLGMGVPFYATITSPIRRYVDLYNHWALQAVLGRKSAEQKALEQNEFKAINTDNLEKLNESLQSIRQGDRELNLWLMTLFAEKNLINNTATGNVRIVTQHGFGVRLTDTGIEGFVAFAKDKEKKYDAKRMTLKVDEVTYEIGKEVSVMIKSVNKEKRQISLELA